MKHLLSILTFFLFLTACDIADKESLVYFTCNLHKTEHLQFKAIIDKNPSEEFPLGRVYIDENYTMKIAKLTDYEMEAVLNNGKNGATSKHFNLHRYTGFGVIKYFFYSTGKESFRQSLYCKKLEKLF
ncbi:hypothetical protein N9J61_02965 [Pelagibacterales bacterium]|nr:hypothetical protein [Pelagibacterales bacterium]